MYSLSSAAAFAVLVWWFTTGIILYLDGLAPRTFRISMAGATAVLVGAIYGLQSSASEASVAGSYCAFSCAVLIWGWLEMSFLMGFITGTRKHACPDQCGGNAHFFHAAGAIIYNELATIAGAAVVAAITWQAANKVGLWTFLVLWSMRLSAKLNLFLGVPNSGETLLPPHLKYLKSFFKTRAMNFLFPISITASTIVATLMVRHCVAAVTPPQISAGALVTSLLILAVIEHWFMVLPWPNEKLWNWGLKSRTMASNAAPGPRIAVKSPSEC